MICRRHRLQLVPIGTAAMLLADGVPVQVPDAIGVSG
jgi:hypothetical protein